MRLPDGEQAAREARRYARAWATQQLLAGELVDDLQLISSELVNNAIRHGSPPYEFDLSYTDGAILGIVSDGSPLLPRTNPSPGEHGGFGLGIVTSCSSRWGTESTPMGKQVWFELK